jgi:hypothetical protein
MTDPTMNGALRRSRLSHHLDDLVSGLALGADEILGLVRVHVLPGANANGEKAPSRSATVRYLSRG